MRPERRFYAEGQEQTTTEVAIWSRPFEDVYAILDAAQPGPGSADLTLIINPMILWLWVGGGVMVLGMIIGLTTPRLTTTGARATATETTERSETVA